MHTGAPSKALSPGPHQATFDSALDRACAERWAERLWQCDASLWTTDPEAADAISNRLGWLQGPALVQANSAELAAWVRQLCDAGLDHIVLCGMGGSSLAPELFARTFGPRPGHPALHVLDTTHPAPIRAVMEVADPARSLYLVSSKSGTTIETESLHRAFRAHAPADRFVAITDPGTVLADEAHKAGFNRVFLNPADIGGRFSALSLFGQVPAALLGINTSALAATAHDMAQRCRPDSGDNPALALGVALGTLAAAGRDRLGLLLSPRLAALGPWIEQLVAESTGKQGNGILPVDGEAPGEPGSYGNDRVFVAIGLAGDTPPLAPNVKQALTQAGHPVLAWTLPDLNHLGAELFLWEAATAFAAAVMEVNPFDEPNVAESKQATAAMLKRLDEGGVLPPESAANDSSGLRVYPGERYRGNAPLAAWLQSHRDGDYIALLSYLPPSPEVNEQLQKLREYLRQRFAAATTLGWGPRFLHSTGQIHKGGNDRCLFLQIAGPVDATLPVPGRSWSFGELQYAQAWGDLEVLRKRARRVLHVEVDAPLDRALATLLDRLRATAP